MSALSKKQRGRPAGPRRVAVAVEAVDVMEPATFAAYVKLAGLVLSYGPKATESHRYARAVVSTCFGVETWDALVSDDLITIEGDGWRLNERGRSSGLRLMYMAEPRPASARPLGARVRWQVLCRDAHRCVYCGATAADVALHVDHIVPVSKGGGDEPSNLATACETCNLGKSDILPEADG